MAERDKAHTRGHPKRRNRFEGRPWLEFRTPALLASSGILVFALLQLGQSIPRVLLAVLFVPAMFVLFVPIPQLAGVILLAKIARSKTMPWDVRLAAFVTGAVAVAAQVAFFAEMRGSGFLGPTN
jgi:hypothetical protein